MKFCLSQGIKYIVCTRMFLHVMKTEVRTQETHNIKTA